MKTGRLFKFHRSGGDVHAYVYAEADGTARAVLYLLAPGRERDPVHEIRGVSTDDVEAEVRVWVDANYPR